MLRYNEQLHKIWVEMSISCTVAQWRSRLWLWHHKSALEGVSCSLGRWISPYLQYLLIFSLACVTVSSRSSSSVLSQDSSLSRYWTWTSAGRSWNTSAIYLPSPSSHVLIKHAASQDVGPPNVHVFTVWWVLMMLYSSSVWVLNVKQRS